MNDIILENKHYRLVIGSDCVAKSLIHKPSGRECLATEKKMALFSVTQPRPYNNEIKLAYPNKRTTFQANRVRREGNRLIVGFELIHYEAEIEITEAQNYISFRLAGFIVPPGKFPSCMPTVPVESFRILQLPVKNAANFGQWLNVSWDEDVAVNMLATSPYAIIDAEKNDGYRVMTADALQEVKLQGTEAALIVIDTPHFLDAIDRFEQDYNLPRGVQSRRRKEIRMSQYFAGYINPENVDRHIQYCKQCGYKMMTVYSVVLFEGSRYDGLGNYEDADYRKTYPEGFASLKKVVQKIKDAGIIPGLHILHPHIGLRSCYVTPVADHRLHKTRYFTLAKPLDMDATTIYVEEYPTNTTMVEACRILQFGGELIHYEGYTTEWPYCFTGCKRGHLDTYVTEHPVGQIGGILDVSEYGGTSCYLDQNSSIQDEIAAKLAKLYSAGFEYLYFDGSEGTNAPYAFHVANGQYRVYKQMEPAPLLCEGAAKTHFSWHMLSGGNAFDMFPPATFKEMTRLHPFDEVARMQQDFTRVNFGWWSVYEELQPDHWEYGNSLAAAWDCPATIQAYIKDLEAHPRLNDLLEVLRRWEDVRINGWLTEEQKQQIIENPQQERILLIDEGKNYELVPYTQIPTADPCLRAFGFERKGRSYVVYWHTQAEGALKLPLSVTLQEELYAPAEETDTLPVSHRRYASSNLPLAQLEKVFAEAKCI
ncbi:MAG: hypothetical protein IJA47_06525 [Oscillospiraceae bacterium]|nr:hypothetical protein [Oscillospiraceae bacterium]